MPNLALSKINNTVYSLELNGVSDKTILFSDRPERTVKSTSNSNFIDSWSIGDDSFACDSPNAVLVVDEQDRGQEVIIIELFEPIYDLDIKTLKYDIIPDNTTSINLSDEFGKITLMIDPTRGDGTTEAQI